MKEEKIEDFFDQFPNKNLAHFLWNIAEDARIEYRIRNNYAGIKKKFEFIDSELFNQIKPQEGLSKKEKAVELMLHLSAFGKTKEEIPKDIEDIVLEGYKKFKEMADMSKMPTDSLKAAMEVYDLIDKIPGDFQKQPNPLNQPLNLDAAKRRKQQEMGETREQMGAASDELTDEQIESMMDAEGEPSDADPNSCEASDNADQDDKEKKKSAAAKDKKDGKKGDKELKVKGLGNKANKEKDKEEPKKPIFYNEWDYRLEDYRYNWCAVEEKKLKSYSPLTFVPKILLDYGRTVEEIKRQFQALKPVRLKRVKKEEFGDEIDIDQLIEAMVDYKAGIYPSNKVYIKTLRKERDISAAFLIDLSGSTSSGMVGGYASVLTFEKISLLLMMEAIESIGDNYGVFGYDSSTNLHNSFYVIKDFNERYNDEVKGRLEGLVSGSSTRTGPALRHTISKLHQTGSKTKLLFHLTDAQPMCSDYYSYREYALHDVKKALEEGRKKSIFTLNLVINSHPTMEYMNRMYVGSAFTIVDDVRLLPKKMLELYRHITT